MTGKVYIYPPPVDNTIAIPVKVLTGAGDGSAFIYLVTPGSWKKQRIVTGEMLGDRIIVKEGLEPGDIYISEGMSYLVQGSRLNIVNH